MVIIYQWSYTNSIWGVHVNFPETTKTSESWVVANQWLRNGQWARMRVCPKVFFPQSILQWLPSLMFNQKKKTHDPLVSSNMPCRKIPPTHHRWCSHRHWPIDAGTSQLKRSTFWAKKWRKVIAAFCSYGHDGAAAATAGKVSGRDSPRIGG